MISKWLWRLRCPATISEISRHFVENYVPIEVFEGMDFESACIDFVDPWFAYRRMIGSIYGVAVCYKPPDDSPTLPGWNRRLWQNFRDTEPDQLVEMIFDEVLAILKAKTASGSQSD